MNPRISIALCTFNGEIYLQQQLESILKQTYLPYEVIVGDDGSTDKTLEILDRFTKIAPFPVVIIKNETRFGYGENFLRTAIKCSGDWVAFCDQDDVWFPEKLEKCAESIKTNQDVIAVMQNSIITDSNLHPIGGIFPNKISPGKYNEFSQNGIHWVWPGFLITFRRDILDKFDITDRPLCPANSIKGQKQMHDRFISALANMTGKILVLDGPVAFHRRHERTVTKVGRKKKRFLSIKLDIEKRNERFNYLRDVAKSWEEYICRHFNKDMEKLDKAKYLYERIYDIYDKRSEIYDNDNMYNRFICYFKIWIIGGYTGNKFYRIRFGIANSIKDLFVVFLKNHISK